jgi:hypothetical protein
LHQVAAGHGGIIEHDAFLLIAGDVVEADGVVGAVDIDALLIAGDVVEADGVVGAVDKDALGEVASMALFWIRVPAALSKRPVALSESTVPPPNPEVPTTSLAPVSSSPVPKRVITRPDTVQLEPVT